MIVNYEDTMREISKRLDGKGCDIVESKDSAYFLFVTHDKDFASLCNLMVSTQGTVDIPFKCKSLSNSGRCYSITNWEVFAVETMKELHTNNDVYVIRIYGSKYTNDEKSYEDGVVLPILHRNGYKISNPTVMGRMSEDDLECLFTGYGWNPYFVTVNNNIKDHEEMAKVLDKVVKDIKKIK